MKLPARRWRVRNGWETDEEGEAAMRSKRRFQSVWCRHDRAARRRRFWREARRPLLAATGIAGCLAWMLASSPWPVTTTLKHHVAFFNRASAQMVGLTPARAGQPGYWDRLDRDEDGVACEWWMPAERRPSAPSLLRSGP